ncbi:MAG: tetratricopeptide repeat protein [Planctomycetota bacterium]
MQNPTEPSPSEQSPSGQSPWIVDVDPRNFEQVVLRGSTNVPVVVDFWATWCEPCKVLGPQLEQAARAGDGRFLLAKVDIDKNPELAQAFGVQSVPAVFAVRDGRMVDGFQGALSPAELTKFLDRVAPAGPGDPLTEARTRATDGDLEGALAEVRALVDDPLHGVPARALLGELLLESDDLDGAREQFQLLGDMDLPPDVAEAVARALRALEGREQAGALPELEAAVAANPNDAAAQLALGRALVAHGKYERGLEALLESVRIDPVLEDGAAKQAMLDSFEVLGLENPLANEYRFQLSLEILA